MPSLLPKLAELGTSIPTIVQPTFSLYTPLLIANASRILSTPRKTFSYGPHPRQTLDLYIPPPPPPSSSWPSSSSSDSPAKGDHRPTKILIFAHGGGLVGGARRLPIPSRDADEGLVYANLGSFFASRGVVTVVMNYRLVGQGHGAVFPSGGEDLGMVVKWVGEHEGELGGVVDGVAKKEMEVCLIGNSAGGVHVGTWCLAEEFEEARREVLGDAGTRLRVKKVVFLAAPSDFEAAAGARGDVLREYYGERTVEHCVLGLLKAVNEKGGKAFGGMEVMILTGTLDPEDEILAPNRRMVEEMKRSSGLQDRVRVEVLQGHNHISPVTALGSKCDEDEEWGRRVVDFIMKDD